VGLVWRAYGNRIKRETTGVCVKRCPGCALKGVQAAEKHFDSLRGGIAMTKQMLIATLTAGPAAGQRFEAGSR